MLKCSALFRRYRLESNIICNVRNCNVKNLDTPSSSDIPSIKTCNIKSNLHVAHFVYKVILSGYKEEGRTKISALYPNFNIISEVSCVLLRRSPRFIENRSHMAQRVIFERLRRFPSRKGPFGVLTLL